MNASTTIRSIPAREIKRRGISAVDELMREGAVQVIKDDVPRYVVLTEERYSELLEESREAALARIREAIGEVNVGQVRRFTNTADLMAAIDAVDQ